MFAHEILSSIRDSIAIALLTCEGSEQPVIKIHPPRQQRKLKPRRLRDSATIGVISISPNRMIPFSGRNPTFHPSRKQIATVFKPCVR